VKRKNIFQGKVKPQAHYLHTMTGDNGKEFAEHKTISQMVGIDFFFAKPYHSWKLGANENADGLIRPYFHKGISFEK
jgi:IS30 family transposase